MTKACGNTKCAMSTGICGSLTFGSGKLSDYGYFSKPCRVCEKAFYNKMLKKWMYKTGPGPTWYR